MTLTANQTPQERSRIINLASATAFLVLIVTAVAGDRLLQILGIAGASFMVSAELY